MNKNQYVNSILKRLLATDRTKKRIRADLMTEIEALEDQGFSLEEIVRQKGEPELVAKEFNDSSSDPEAQRQYYLQRGLKIAVIVLLVSAVLLVLAGTALHYLPFWYTPPLTEGETVAIIGGWPHLHFRHQSSQNHGFCRPAADSRLRAAGPLPCRSCRILGFKKKILINQQIKIICWKRKNTIKATGLKRGFKKAERDGCVSSLSAFLPRRPAMPTAFPTLCGLLTGSLGHVSYPSAFASVPLIGDSSSPLRFCI